jgi:hypothetical protein
VEGMSWLLGRQRSLLAEGILGLWGQLEGLLPPSRACWVCWDSGTDGTVALVPRALLQPCCSAATLVLMALLHWYRGHCCDPVAVLLLWY